MAREIQGNEAESKEQKKGKLSLTVILNIVQMALFLAFTIKSFGEKFAESQYMPFIMTVMAVYVVIFVVLVVLLVKDKNRYMQNSKALKGSVKDFKLTIRVVTTIMLVLNVAASVLMVIESFSADATFFAKTVALVSIAYSVLNALISVLKVARKVKKRVKKARKNA